jgi:acyl-CoA-dependent ceramide synthase
MGELPLYLAYGEQQDDGSMRYGYGSKDAYFICVSVFLLTFLRGVFLRLVSQPLSRWMKVKRKQDYAKFDDMAWQGIYYLTAWISGFMIMYNRPWGFQLDQMTAGFPWHKISGDMKLYYMLQCSFWLHAIVIQTVEMWRKDFWMYYLHHFITSSLCVGSYFKGATRIGFYILVEQDFADIFLPFAKCLNYADWEPASTIVFATFAVAWIPTRHYLYNLFLIEIWNLDLSHPEAAAALSYNEWMAFFIFLSALQVLLCIWLKELLFAVYKAVQPEKKLTDHRSSGEEDTD